MQTKEEKKLASTGSVLRAYWHAAAKYPWLLVLVIAGGVTLQLSTLAAPWFLKDFFNLLAAGDPSKAVVHSMAVLLGFVALMYAIEWVGRRIQSLSTMILETRVMKDLLVQTFEYLLRHSYNFFISRFAGSLTHRVSRFSRAFETLFDSIVLSFFPTALFVLGAVVILGHRSMLLGATLLLWVICFVLFQTYVSLLRQPLRITRSEAETKVTAVLADAISNQPTISLFSGVKHEAGLFRTTVEYWRAATKRAWFADDFTWAAIGIFIVIIEVGLLYGGLLLWERGLLTVGDFVLIQSYLIVTFDRLVAINRELRRFYDAFADAAEMVAILEMPHEVKDIRGAKKLAVTEGEVWFDDVTFGFHADSILRDLNVTIAGGERVALVGPSGAGKTTVTKLLLRLYDLKGGEIRIDGQNIASVTQDSLRDNIAFVPQEPILFHRTLMENIRYGRRDATDEEVMEAAKKAHCHEFIEKLPQKYETYVGERGVKLSGGERQRVAIARAILKNAPLLVLDEATSSLDSESEALIQDALEVLMQGKTVVVIAHRLSTIMKMDRIIVMEAGSIVAQGTHLELINQPGLYQKLWSIQAGGFLGDGDTQKEEGEEDELYPRESDGASLAEEEK